MALGGALGSGLGAPWSRVTPRHCAWQAWHLVTSTFVSRGRRGTISHPPSFCVAGVAPTIVLCGRRGTISHPPSFRVAGVALMALGGALGSGLGAPWSRVTPRHCVWQAWHLVTSTFVSRGRRGTISYPQAFCVAGVAQSHIHHRFAWQAWHNLTSTIVSRGRRGTHGTGWRALLTHHFVSHHLSPLPHTILHHTIFHTKLCHPPSLTHHLSHTSLPPTIFDTTSFTHNFVTHHHLHTIFFTHHLFHTPSLSHTIFHTPSLTHHL